MERENGDLVTIFRLMQLNEGTHGDFCGGLEGQLTQGAVDHSCEPAVLP